MERLDDRRVLLVDVDQAQRGVIHAADGGDAELERLGPRVDVLGLDGQGLEDGQADGVDVGAGPGDHEALVEGREGELARAGRQEGQSAGDLVEDGAVEAVLLALLPDDGGHAADQAGVAVGGEQALHVLERAEDDVGEGRGERNSVFEARDREVVFTGLDGGFVEVRESPVGIERVELFLGDNRVEGGEHEVYRPVVANVVMMVALDLVGDVVDELGEEGDLGEFVEGDEPETCLGVVGDASWGRAIGEAAVRGLLDVGERIGGVGYGGKAVGQGELEGSGGDEREAREAGSDSERGMHYERRG